MLVNVWALLVRAVPGRGPVPGRGRRGRVRRPGARGRLHRRRPRPRWSSPARPAGPTPSSTTPTSPSGRRLQVTALPQTFFVRADGTVAGRHAGAFTSPAAARRPEPAVPRGGPVSAHRSSAAPAGSRRSPPRCTATTAPGSTSSARPGGRAAVGRARALRRGADGVRGAARRARATLRSHPGQIAFPGGGADPEDADLADTALREAYEECGVLRDGVEVLGALAAGPRRGQRLRRDGGGGLVARPAAVDRATRARSPRCCASPSPTSSTRRTA